ncbi:MAG: DNA polymerase III subunit delta [Hyphomonas sp.]
MLLKGKQATNFSKRPDDKIWAVLAFGEDEGLAADAATALIKAWTPKNQQLEVISLDDDAIKKDPSLLFDALDAVSLLGDDRLIRVRTKGDKIGALLVEALTMAETSPNRFAAKLIIETGALTTKSKLRKFAEGATHTACLQFFADQAEDVTQRVESALLDAGMAIEPDALALFVGDLPGHRTLANSEVEKLILYAMNLGRAVNTADIRALCATDLEHDMSTAIRATLSGQTANAHSALDRLEQIGTSPVSILRSLQMEVTRMLDAHTKIGAGNGNPGRMLRPPVWQSEWPAFRQRLSKWPTRHLLRVLERVYDAERQAKTAGPSAGPTVRMLINDLAKVAERSN